MSQSARFLDAAIHQRDADAAAALFGLDRERTQKQRFVATDCIGQKRTEP